MEIRISCPDATGLGCDIARALLDFGLKEVQGDVSTDGKWCFLIFKASTASLPAVTVTYPPWSAGRARSRQPVCCCWGGVTPEGEVVAQQLASSLT